MTVEYIRYRIDEPPRRVRLRLPRGGEALDDSEYCLGYQLTQCEEEPDRFILRIRWTSTDDHLNKFRSSEQFRRFFRQSAVRRRHRGDAALQVVEGWLGSSAASRRAT